MKRFLLFSLFFLSFYSFNAFADTESQDSQHRDFDTIDSPIDTIRSPTECYKIIKKLGEGAFGKVYAVENSSGMPFAIKTYKNALDTSTSASLNFYTDAQREFSRGQLLNHPNIIKSYDLFMSDTEEGIANIVLDLVNGQTLFETERGDIGYPYLLRATVQFIDAIQYALSMNLMHLDLHGGNIMLDDDSNIMVIDLASFFTFDEIHDFLVHKLHSTGEFKIVSEEKKSSQGLSSPVLSRGVRALPVKVQNEPTESAALPLAPLRAAKLEKFFDEHPRVFRKIKADIKEKEALNSIKTNNTRKFSKSVNVPAGMKSEKSSNAVDLTQINLSPVQANYFDRITEICIKLISISDTNREEKIEMRANIKKIAWNYEEDMEEGISLPLMTYLEKLLHTVQSN